MADKWKAIADRIIEKERAVAERNRGRIPYTTETPHAFGDWSGPDRISWWTNGFWGGMLWQLWHATGEDLFRESALDVEKKLDAVLLDYNGMDHDAGFRWLPTAVAHYRTEGDAASRNRGLLAAANLAGRFNLFGNFIRAWNDWGDDRDTTGWAIIDCMMNLPLLHWATDELNDPRFRMIADKHADTVIRHFIRKDNSVCHIIGFDPGTGSMLREYGGQGISEGSSWTRGQSWALYGFTLSALHTGGEPYLAVAMRVADRYIERIPEDGLIPVDFDQEASCPWRDATSAAIAACGLLTLAGLLRGEIPEGLPDKERAKMRFLLRKPQEGSKQAEKYRQAAEHYREAAERLLLALDSGDADYDPAHDELLTKCTAAYHDREHNFPIIYGDYFYIEAIWKLTGRELFIW
ncbi:MAG: glycoside hydrolase family 88 protein [Lachnospiraceae bacterium]|nr:glycoside hydrolase family 88 protein [Lachnospiraceae bacterium]